MGKKERDFLRESLSNMKQVFEHGAELPEEIIKEEEPIPDKHLIHDKSTPAVFRAKPKIVCPSLYANTATAVSQSPLPPFVTGEKELVEAIKLENEKIGKQEKQEKKAEKPKKKVDVCRPFSQVNAQRPGRFDWGVSESVATEREYKKVEEIKRTSLQQEEPKGLQNIFERLQRLDKEKIDKLVKMLDLIEDNKQPLQALDAQTSKSTKEIPTQIRQKEPIPTANEEKVLPNKTTSSKKHELIFRIISTWGNPHVVGLTEIEAFDKEGSKIPLVLSARNLGPGAVNPIAKLTNGKMYVNDERHMWIAYLPPHPKFLEIVCTLPMGVTVGGIAVWNYNKSSFESVKGVCEAEIYIDGSQVWTGTIKRGNGWTNEDYSTEILLCENSNVFKEKSKPLPPVDVEEEVEMPKELLELKQKIEEGCSRPISVPVFVQGQQIGQSLDTKKICKPEAKPNTESTMDNSSKVSDSTNLSVIGIKESLPNIKRHGPQTRTIFGEKSSKPFSKNMRSGITKPGDLKPAGMRGRRQQVADQQRDQSIERHIDQLSIL